MRIVDKSYALRKFGFLKQSHNQLKENYENG